MGSPNEPGGSRSDDFFLLVRRKKTGMRKRKTVRRRASMIWVAFVVQERVADQRQLNSIEIGVE